jgi:hypothetical protein
MTHSATNRAAISTFYARGAELAFVALSLGIVMWVTWDAFAYRLITNNPGADYWEHTAVLRALLEDPWHPSHPLIEGNVPSPRFNPHFLWLALVGRSASLDSLDTMSLAAVVNTLLLVAGIYLFAKEYFRSSLAPLIALVVWFGSWLDAPHFSNVYKFSVYFSVAGYPSTAALAVMLFGLTIVIRALRAERDRPALWGLSTLAWAYVYITHPLTAMLAFTAAGLLALTEPAVSRARRLWMLGSLLASVFLASLWPYYPALGMVAEGTVDRVQRGIEEGKPALHSFYEAEKIFGVLGFASLAALAFPFFVVRRTLLVVPLGAATMLAVFGASAVLDIPLGHRFLLLSVFFVQLGLIWLLLRMFERRRAPSPTNGLGRTAAIGLPVLAATLLVWMAVSNVVTARERFAGGRAPGTESATVRYGRRVAELAGPHAVVLADPLASWSLPTFGPKIVTLHHRNPLIRDAAERDRAAKRFFGRASDAERRAILERFHVTHVVISPRNGSHARAFLEAQSPRRGLPFGRFLFTIRRDRR